MPLGGRDRRYGTVESGVWASGDGVPAPHLWVLPLFNSLIRLLGRTGRRYSPGLPVQAAGGVRATAARKVIVLRGVGPPKVRAVRRGVVAPGGRTGGVLVKVLALSTVREVLSRRLAAVLHKSRRADGVLEQPEEQVRLRLRRG